MSLLLRAIVVGALLAIVVPGAANAAPTLTVAVAADPVESVTTQVSATGSATTSSHVTVHIKPAGGAACGANPNADNATRVICDYVGIGPYSEQTNWTFQDAGSYVVCGWLTDESQSSSPVVASATLTVTVRIPRLLLAVSAPEAVTVGQPFQVTTTAQAEVSRGVWEVAVPDTGRGCAANYIANQGVVDRIVGRWDVAGGPFSDVENVTLSSAGTFLLCAYFQRDFDDTVPEATAVATVVARSPCVVPAVGSGVLPATMSASLTAGGCTPGAVSYAPSTHHRKGTVAALSATSGASLAPLTPVGIVVSTGAPCVVPRVSAGARLGTAKSRLHAAGCTTGRITRAYSSRVRRGRVIRLGRTPGTRLAAKAAVGVVVSRGARRHR